MSIRSSKQPVSNMPKSRMVIYYITSTVPCRILNYLSSPRFVKAENNLFHKTRSQNSVSTCLLLEPTGVYGLGLSFRQRRSTFSLQEELAQGALWRHQLQGTVAFSIPGLGVCSKVHEQAGQLPTGRPGHRVQRGIQPPALVHARS